jgi:hypothetical protein
MNVEGARSEGARFHLFVNSAPIDPRDRARGCSNDRACGSAIDASVAPRHSRAFPRLATDPNAH